NRIVPRAIVFVGVITESPVGIVKWQSVDGQVEQIMRWDKNADGRLSRREIAEGSARQPIYSAVGKLLEGQAPEAGWSRPELLAFFERRYQEMKADALQTDDSSPYPKPIGERECTSASYRWWRQWFTDETPTIDLLKDYGGTLVFHFGEIDSQAPARR